VSDTLPEEAAVPRRTFHAFLFTTLLITRRITLKCKRQRLPTFRQRPQTQRAVNGFASIEMIQYTPIQNFQRADGEGGEK